MNGNVLTAPPAALAINAGKQPFVLAAVLATAAALPICGADWHRGEELLEYEVLAAGLVITCAVIASSLRGLAAVITLVGVPIVAAGISYWVAIERVHQEQRALGYSGDASGEVTLAPFLQNHTTWIAAIVFASLAGLAGWRRGGAADAHDRNGVLVGAWLTVVGGAVGVVGLAASTWRLPEDLLRYDYNTLVGGWCTLRVATITAGAVTAAVGVTLALASAVRRRRRRAFLDAVVEGRAPGWSIDRGDDPRLPMFLDPSRAPTGVLVRGAAGAGGPPIARVRTVTS